MVPLRAKSDVETGRFGATVESALVVVCVTVSRWTRGTNKLYVTCTNNWSTAALL